MNSFRLGMNFSLFIQVRKSISKTSVARQGRKVVKKTSLYDIATNASMCRIEGVIVTYNVKKRKPNSHFEILLKQIVGFSNGSIY